MDAGAKSRVAADPLVCVGSGMCEHIAPAYFDASEGVVNVLREEIEPSDRAEVVEAVGACPTRALTIHAAQLDGTPGA